MNLLPSVTAEAVCFMRAVDQLNPPDQRVIDDPFAKHFLSPVWSGILAIPPLAWRTLPLLTTYIRARHRYMDDALRQALIARPDIAQVVIMGAGYDARAFRLGGVLGERPVYELDFPTTAARKQRCLEQANIALPPTRRALTIDFQRQSVGDVLLAAGFDRTRPTFFFWEGVSMYLRRSAVHTALGAMADLAAPGSVMTMDYWRFLDSPDLGASLKRFSAALLALVSEPVTFPMDPEDVPDFMAKDGWSVTDIAEADELTRRYMPDGRAVYPGNFVITAQRAAGATQTSR